MLEKYVPNGKDHQKKPGMGQERPDLKCARPRIRSKDGQKVVGKVEAEC